MKTVPILIAAAILIIQNSFADPLIGGLLGGKQNGSTKNPLNIVSENILASTANSSAASKNEEKSTSNSLLSTTNIIPGLGSSPLAVVNDLKLDSVSSTLNETLSATNLASITSTVTALNDNVTSLSSDTDSIGSGLTNINSSLSSISSSLSNINESFSSVQSSLTTSVIEYDSFTYEEFLITYYSVIDIINESVASLNYLNGVTGGLDDAVKQFENSIVALVQSANSLTYDNFKNQGDIVSNANNRIDNIVNTLLSIIESIKVVTESNEINEDVAVVLSELLEIIIYIDNFVVTEYSSYLSEIFVYYDDIEIDLSVSIFSFNYHLINEFNGLLFTNTVSTNDEFDSETNIVETLTSVEESFQSVSDEFSNFESFFSTTTDGLNTLVEYSEVYSETLSTFTETATKITSNLSSFASLFNIDEFSELNESFLSASESVSNIAVSVNEMASTFQEYTYQFSKIEGSATSIAESVQFLSNTNDLSTLVGIARASSCVAQGSTELTESSDGFASVLNDTLNLNSGFSNYLTDVSTTLETFKTTTNTVKSITGSLLPSNDAFESTLSTLGDPVSNISNSFESINSSIQTTTTSIKTISTTISSVQDTSSALATNLSTATNQSNSGLSVASVTQIVTETHTSVSDLSTATNSTINTEDNESLAATQDNVDVITEKLTSYLYTIQNANSEVVAYCYV